MQKKQARIVGMEAYLPERVMSNQDFEAFIQTSDEWIISRTGIKERRVASSDQFTSDMAAAAGKKALAAAQLSPEEVELIIVATMSPDYISSSSAALVQSAIGATRAAAFDIQAACTGFIYALSTAKAFVESGMYKNVLVIAAEKMSTYLNYTDRTTCILFGDGAGAAVVTDQGEGLAIDAISLGADGSGQPLISIPAGGVRHPASSQTLNDKMHYMTMKGRDVFKYAVRQMAASAQQCLEKEHLVPEDIQWLVPHQANIRIMEAVLEMVNMPPERMYQNVHKYGNTSAASIPIALSELLKEHPILVDQRLLLVGFGAGLTWGAAILKKVME